MNQVLNFTAQQERRMAHFTGSDTLHEGYPLCFNRDSSTGVTTTSQETDKIYRDTEVEKPAAGNFDDFAGVVAPEYDGRTGPCEVEVISKGVCRVWTGAATVINSTDIGIGATYICLAATSAIPAIAKALVTDASTTAKARLAVLYDHMGVPMIDMLTSLTGASNTGTSLTGSSTNVNLKGDIAKLANKFNVLYSELKEARLMKRS